MPHYTATATPRRWGTPARQRNAQRTSRQQAHYVQRTWGTAAAHAWRTAYATGGLPAAWAAVARYRYQHAR